MNNADKFQLSSSFLLHLIRGGAAQAVLVGHGLAIFGIKSMPYLQNSAVVVFFILSGFVIPYSSFIKARKYPSYSFSSYFIDRFSRIYMGFVPALFFVLGLELFSRHFLRVEYPD